MLGPPEGRADARAATLTGSFRGPRTLSVGSLSTSRPRANTLGDSQRGPGAPSARAKGGLLSKAWLQVSACNSLVLARAKARK